MNDWERWHTFSIPMRFLSEDARESFIRGVSGYQQGWPDLLERMRLPAGTLVDSPSLVLADAQPFKLTENGKPVREP